MKRRVGALFAIGAAVTLSASPVAAQAFTAPQGLGSFTLAWQYIDNTGHRLSDGYLIARGQSVTTSLLFEGDYAITDRFSATAGIPYVFARYTGALPPPSGLPLDACKCWHSSFQDFSLTGRYRFGNETWAVTPHLGFVQPSHRYRYRGEANVGRRLREAGLGVDAGWRLSGALHNMSLQTGYTYSIVEKAIRDISVDRSNAYFDAGYALTNRIYIHGLASWQRTHGGLQVGSITGHPFPFPGQLNTPERRAEGDRLISVQYLHAGGGLAYSAGPVDFFVAVEKYIRGKNTHNGQAYTIGSTWYFDLSK